MSKRVIRCTCVLDLWKHLGKFLLMEAHAGLFVGLLLIVFAISREYTFLLPRYDFIFAAALLIQSLLIIFKFETMSEVRAITFFHIVGFVLEVFKTHPSIGSWSYPEFGYTKILGVPLYAGFMYASIGSYMMRAWKDFELSIIHPPKRWLAVLLASLVYLNFFTHHYIFDFRYILIALILFVFRKTTIHYRAFGGVRRLHSSLVFFFFGIMIWIAENIATYLGAWQYPHQSLGWHIVHPQKIISWALLVIISFIIVASRDKAWRGLER
ncbi:MAG TPA: DUF817 domain-containing protein [Candidatus Paceibacterota bacterium]|nr:DUF817 domain-containing protein [Candidatus Paceibacterota bacterium]